MRKRRAGVAYIHCGTEVIVHVYNGFRELCTVGVGYRCTLLPFHTCKNAFVCVSVLLRLLRVQAHKLCCCAAGS